MFIKRDFYLNQLIDSKHNGMIKIITGLRLSCKSYLLFEIFYSHLLESHIDPDHIIKFAFDSQDYLDILGEDLLDINIKNRKVDPKNFLIILKIG